MPFSLRLRPGGHVLRVLCGPVVVAAALSASGCGSDSPTTPVGPTPTQITETFDGTVTINGAITQPFEVQTAGTISATLTALDPSSVVVDGETRDTTVGLSIGTFNGVVCAVGAPNFANDSAKVGVSLTASATATGRYCARVYDVGKLTQATAFQLTVTHY